MTAQTELSPEAIRAVAKVIGDRHGCAPDAHMREAREILEAAAPHLAAAERERCAQLAEQYHTTWLEPCDADDHERGLHTHHRRPFAALLREQP